MFNLQEHRNLIRRRLNELKKKTNKKRKVTVLQWKEIRNSKVKTDGIIHI